MARVLILWILLLAPLAGHQIDELHLRLDITGNRMEAVVEVDAAYMLPEYRGDAELAPLDLAWLRTLEPAELERVAAETRSYLGSCLRFESGGVPVEPAIQLPDLGSAGARFRVEGIPEALPMLEVRLSAPLPGPELSVEWNEPFGVVLIITRDSGITPLVSGSGAEFHPTGDPMNLLDWIHLGFVHILPAGLDHILFILGIFLRDRSWKPLVGKSLVFTAAHSLTLALAVLGIVSLPDKPVEVAIAASIAWIGIENLLDRPRQSWELAVIAGFGLLHGLGFASQLGGWVDPARPGQLPLALTGFNLGVELGQLAVLLGAGLALGWIDSFTPIRKAGGGLIAAAGIFWVVSRLF